MDTTWSHILSCNVFEIAVLATTSSEVLAAIDRILYGREDSFVLRPDTVLTNTKPTQEKTHHRHEGHKEKVGIADL